MNIDLTGKKILIVEGAMLSTAELREALMNAGAQVYITGKLLTAFDMLQRKRFDGALIDHGLHNMAFDLCEELRDHRIPFITCNSPHRLQGVSARRSDAEFAVWRLASVISSKSDMDAAYVPPNTRSRRSGPNKQI